MVGIWVLFASLSIIGKVVFYGLQKKWLDDDISALRMSQVSAFYCLLFLLPIGGWSLWTTPITIPRTDWALIVGIVLLEVFGLFVSLEALARTDLGIASSMKSLKTILVGLIEPFLLGFPVTPILIGAAGSASIGSYLVMMKGNDVLAPLKRVRSTGVQLALLTAVIYAVLSIGSRFANTRISPAVFGVIVYTAMVFVYTGVLVRKGESVFPGKFRQRKFVFLGSVGASRSLVGWTAYSLAAATVVSSFNQLNILLSVLVGGALLGEEDTKRRLIGAGLILAGAVLVVVNS